MDFLKFCIKSKAIMITVLIELFLHGTIYVLGGDIAKWHFLGWLIVLATIISARIILKPTK